MYLYSITGLYYITLHKIFSTHFDSIAVYFVNCSVYNEGYKYIFKNVIIIKIVPGREIIFPTAVPDPQYELICIQPIRDDFFFS